MNKDDIIDIMYRKIEMIPYNGTIVLSFFPTLSSIYPLADLNKGYAYNPESLYIETITEQEIDFGRKEKVKALCYIAEDRNDYLNKIQTLREFFLGETILNNLDESNVINIVGDITDIDPDDEESTLALPQNTSFLQISIFKKSSKEFYIFLLPTV